MTPMDMGTHTFLDEVTLLGVGMTGAPYSDIDVSAYRGMDQVAETVHIHPFLWFHVPATVHAWVACDGTIGSSFDPTYARGLAGR